MKSVLIVDDEPAVGATVSRLVRAAGYDPVYVNTAAAALERLEKEPDRFTVVLSDVHMTPMDGMALAQRVSEIWPSLPIILTSGDSGPSPVSLGCVRGVTAVLDKPVRLNQLKDLLAHHGKT